MQRHDGYVEDGVCVPGLRIVVACCSYEKEETLDAAAGCRVVARVPEILGTTTICAALQADMPPSRIRSVIPRRDASPISGITL